MGSNAQETRYVRLARRSFKKNKRLSGRWLGHYKDEEHAEQAAAKKGMKILLGTFTPCVINRLKYSNQSVPKTPIVGRHCVPDMQNPSHPNELGTITFRVKKY